MVNYGWSKDRNTWNNIPINMPEIDKWKTIPFNINQNILLKKERGLYIISMNSLYFNQSFSTPIYVGHSINLYERFTYHINGHFKDSMLKRIKNDLNYKSHGDSFKIQYSYCYMKNEHIKEIKKCEQFLIDIYGPKFNRINASRGIRSENIIKGHLG